MKGLKTSANQTGMQRYWILPRKASPKSNIEGLIWESPRAEETRETSGSYT